MKIYKINHSTELDDNLYDNNNNKTLQKLKILQNENIKNIKFIKYAKQHAVFVNSQNEIFVYGKNKDGRLGIGNLEDYNKFTKITHKNIVKLLECGNTFTIIVNDKNQFFGSGEFLNVICCKEFTKFYTTKEDVKFLTCGENHLFFVTKNNCLFGIGDNFDGQLGLQKRNSFYTNSATKIITNFVKIENLKIEIKDLKCGLQHSMLLDKNGNIYGTGNNENGQLGFGSIKKIKKFTKINFTQTVKQITTFPYGTLLLTENNEIYGTGRNMFGELGIGNLYNRHNFTKIVISENNFIFNNLFQSFGYYNVICGFDKNQLVDKIKKFTIFVTGDNFNGLFGITENNEMLSYGYFGFKTFKKLNFFKKYCKYIYLILLENDIFIVTSNYKINSNNGDEERFLGFRCYEKLIGKQLVDVTIKIM